MNPIKHLVGLLGRGAAHRKASTDTGQYNIGMRGHTSVPGVGFEPTFKRSKVVQSLDRVVIVIDAVVLHPSLTVPNLSRTSHSTRHRLKDSVK
jgi:hypothetical protein